MARSRTARSVSPMRSFAPHRLGRYECDAWVTYYRHDWKRFLPASIGMVQEGFGMPAHRTLQGAYLVLRANQLWAPYPDNDAAGAERTMRAFYALVDRVHGLGLDPVEAARREVRWWGVHRELQHTPGADERAAAATAGDAVAAAEALEGADALTDALADLYSYVYAVEPESVRTAGELRARAMVFSDLWVRQGCDLGSPLLVEELTCLVRSYGSLLAAVRPRDPA